MAVERRPDDLSFRDYEEASDWFEALVLAEWLRNLLTESSKKWKLGNFGAKAFHIFLHFLGLLNSF